MLYNTLIPGCIGIHGLTLQESITLAKDAGFKGVTWDGREAKEIVDRDGIAALKAMFDDAGIRPATWNPWVDWTNDATRDADIANLGPLCEIANELGARNVTTGIMPANNERPYDEQFAYLQERLYPYAAAMATYGQRIGIEFITPKTLRDQFQYQFIYKMTDMLAFGKAIGTGNVGVLFDVWHHYCAHGTLEEMDVLTADDVQLVHTNDAPLGLEIDEQQDLTRELPMATGVIPAAEMLRKLADIGCDVGVGPEPFHAGLNELAAKDPLAAAKMACEAQKKLFAAAGLDA